MNGTVVMALRKANETAVWPRKGVITSAMNRTPKECTEFKARRLPFH
jgi:hypothetical protein